MFFYDGGVIVPNNDPPEPYKVKATYQNGMPMAIIQGNVGVIGCHPESQAHWYESYSWMKDHYHNGSHHKLLLNFVDRLMLG